MKESVLQLILAKIEQVKKLGHGEVIVKIKNGIVYRILATEDKLVE